VDIIELSGDALSKIPELDPDKAGKPMTAIEEAEAEEAGSSMPFGALTGGGR
jgi:hypothetical protein